MFSAQLNLSIVQVKKKQRKGHEKRTKTNEGEHWVRRHRRHTDTVSLLISLFVMPGPSNGRPFSFSSVDDDGGGGGGGVSTTDIDEKPRLPRPNQTRHN